MVLIEKQHDYATRVTINLLKMKIMNVLEKITPQVIML